MNKALQEIKTPASTLELAAPADMFEQIKQTETMLKVAESYSIDSPEMLEAASDELKLIKAFYKKIEETEKEFTKPLHDLKSKWIAFFKSPKDQLNQAERKLKAMINDYLNEQKRIEAQKQAEAAKAARQEQARLEAEAAKAAEQGKLEEAQELQAQAVHVPTPVVQSHTPKVTGISQTTTYKAEVIDKMALIKAVAQGTIPDMYLTVNMVDLNKLAKSQKEQMSIPGVKVVKETGISARA